MSAIKLAKKIMSKEISVVEAVKYYIEKAEKNEYNAFIGCAEEQAICSAERVQKLIDAGEKPSPLAGVPFGVKDNISTAGIATTCASKMLDGYVPVFDATVIEKTERAGMIVIGKLNMDEFAMGGSSETGVFGAVKNPWDITRVSGGSSGGSAAAVSAEEIPIALGSDTGGSIRQPCAFCGVTGIKPTYGAVSRYGLIAYASSLDQIGVIGADIDDCAALLGIICGGDEKDGTCIINSERLISDNNNKKIKIGLPKNYFSGGIDDEVKESVLSAAKEFENSGAEIEEFDMPYMDYIIHAYYIIACAEASSNLSRYDGLKYGYRSEDAKTLSDVYRFSRNEGFGMEVKRRILLGSFVLSSGYYDAYYKKALKTRTLIKNAYNELFKKYDMILSPVAPTTAYKIGENIDDPVKMYMGDIYTVSVNLGGLPAASLPCGFDKAGLPIGFQLIGGAFSEAKLINAARVYQSRTDYHTKKPKKNERK